jgi:hypothetical protein
MEFEAGLKAEMGVVRYPYSPANGTSGKLKLTWPINEKNKPEIRHPS